VAQVKNMKKVLAFDIGASNGRAVVGAFDGQKISLTEKHRFANEPVYLNGTLYWDTLRQFHEIKQGILKCFKSEKPDSVGIDTFGVDFGLIDAQGNLLENPIHYRDIRTRGMVEETLKLIPQKEFYSITGIQFMEPNTVFQLFSLARKRPEQLARVKSFLMMPDMFNYFLTGQQHTEYTIASTTQMLSADSRNWAFDIIKRLNLPVEIFRDIVNPGKTVGSISGSVCKELGIEPVPVIAVASHDTASAVVSVPVQSKDFAYISCGTWSLLGTEIEEPVINDRSFACNFTNEGGYDNKIRYLKNIVGLWLIQEVRRQLLRNGSDLSFSDLEQAATKSEAFKCFIDPDAPEFMRPGDIIGSIRAFCELSGQFVPQTVGEIVRCIYESLSFKYRFTFGILEEMTGKHFDSINIVGGGANDKFLSNATAGACARAVSVGPAEATILGNIMVQLIESGEIASLAQARQVIAESYKQERYEPSRCAEWDVAAERFAKILYKQN
jgi:rhamnulokinase